MVATRKNSKAFICLLIVAIGIVVGFLKNFLIPQCSALLGPVAEGDQHCIYIRNDVCSDAVPQFHQIVVWIESWCIDPSRPLVREVLQSAIIQQLGQEDCLVVLDRLVATSIRQARYTRGVIQFDLTTLAPFILHKQRALNLCSHTWSPLISHPSKLLTGICRPIR